MTWYGQMILLSLVSLMLFMAMYSVNNLYMSICLTILILIKYLYFIFKIKTVSRAEYIKIRQMEQKYD